MAGAVASTHGDSVLGGLGGFAGAFDLGVALGETTDAVLVASTDGVGTKAAVAVALGQVTGLGADVVHHCVNDVLTQGARPLFFLDYLGSAQLDSERVASVVRGMAAACKEVGCALLGGETAAMPTVYQAEGFDVVGTLVGVVQRDERIDGGDVRIGDVVIGLASSGLHTNGYSLARSLVAGLDLQQPRSDLGGVSLGDALLTPHVHYLREVTALRAADVPIHGLAHITGGGLLDNPPRVLTEEMALTLTLGSWQEPPIFELLRDLGRIAEAEMRRVFNLGLGMLAIVPADHADAALAALRDLSGGARAWRVGEVVAREGSPQVRFLPVADATGPSSRAAVTTP